MKSNKSVPTKSQEEARRGLERIGNGNSNVFKALLNWNPQPPPVADTESLESTEINTDDSTSASTKTSPETSTQHSAQTLPSIPESENPGSYHELPSVSTKTSTEASPEASTQHSAQTLSSIPDAENPESHRELPSVSTKTSTEAYTKDMPQTSTQISTKDLPQSSTQASGRSRSLNDLLDLDPDLISDLIKDPLILTPREEKILAAILPMVDGHDRFWCRSSEVMQLSGVKTLRWFFKGMKSLQARGILSQVAGYRGCHKGTLYQLDRSSIPPEFLPTDSTRTSASASTQTGPETSAQHSAKDMPQTSSQASTKTSTKERDFGNDHDLIDLDLKDLDTDQIHSSTPEMIILEYTKITGKAWLKSYDRLWISLTEKAEYKHFSCSPANIVEMMKNASTRASRIPTTFRFFAISIVKQWQERKRSLLITFWQDIQAKEAATDYSSKVESLKLRFAEIGLTVDGQLIDEVTHRRKA